MFDLVALGELLIDWTPAGLSPMGMCLFERNPGGAPANVALALASLGMKSAFIGKVGADMHGDFLRTVLAGKGVDVTALLRDEEAFTTLAFVSLNESGERTFSFARKPGADTRIRPDELPLHILKQCRIFHFGSLSLTDEPARSATLEAIRLAKLSGAAISYDPNYRAPLWKSRSDAIEQMRAVLPFVDYLKISDEETGLLAGKEAVQGAAQSLLEKGISAVVVTLGKEGAYAAIRSKGAVYSTTVPAPEVQVVDTTGAGDAFWSGFLYRLLEANLSLTEETLRSSVEYANAAGAFCVQRRGAIQAMPKELGSEYRLL
ncbi:MAG: carbohydrate kinase [Spirochaetaceae bacterium]|jgi:fructokinase|nr:carbohydrate kinase [Spirochaetaceae bacterium]